MLTTLLRPKTIDEIIGQEHLLGRNKPLRNMVERDVFRSVILWGPPGSGKTSIVSAIAQQTASEFHKLNATEATVKDIRKIIDRAKSIQPIKTFVFVDEIHRWSKSQQDVMLPVVEDATIVLFGATTEKPKFAVNSTLLSRCLVFEVKPLNGQEVVKLLIRIREHYSSSDKPIKLSRDVVKRIINRCSGDARKIITVVEAAYEILSQDGLITETDIDEVMPDKHIIFDARGNDHYDLAHCYQESIQNSDADAAIYWLAKWLESGEDPAYICRRMLITAFEDCAGNPAAWTAAVGACFTAERTGMPECMIPMALATCEMAKSKRNKSAFYAIHAAMADVRNGATIHVPPELRAGNTGYMHAINKKYIADWIKDDGQ